MSISELARRSGVAKGTLSTLETGAGNPTVETLWSLAGALGVPLTDLLGEVTDEAFVLRADASPILTGKTIEARAIDRVFGREVLDIIDVTFPAGGIRKVPGHPPGTVTRLYVVAGRVRVELRGETIELEPGDFIRFESDVPHTFVPRGGDARMLGLMSFEFGGDPNDPIRAALAY